MRSIRQPHSVFRSAGSPRSATGPEGRRPAAPRSSCRAGAPGRVSSVTSSPAPAFQGLEEGQVFVLIEVLGVADGEDRRLAGRGAGVVEPVVVDVGQVIVAQADY